MLLSPLPNFLVTAGLASTADILTGDADMILWRVDNDPDGSDDDLSGYELEPNGLTGE